VPLVENVIRDDDSMADPQYCIERSGTAKGLFASFAGSLGDVRVDNKSAGLQE
jgi:hypothetical protein